MRPLRLLLLVALASALTAGAGLPAQAAAPEDRVRAAVSADPAEVAAPVAAAAVPAAVHRGRDADGVEQYDLPSGAVPPRAPTGRTVEADYSVRIAGVDRVFRLHLPATRRSPAPLVVALHGWYQSRQSAQSYMEWDAVAAAHGFAVLYPQGHRSSWNAGQCCGGARAEGVDDVAALLQMVALAGEAHPLDPGRRYLAGFSNGGMMALAAACRRPDAFAAVLAVGAAHVDSCRPRRPVPVLQVNGDRDGTVAWAGTAHSPFLGIAVPSVEQTRRTWLAANAAPRKGAMLSRARPRTPTTLVRIVDGGHTWPRAVGTGGTPYATTVQGWAFFAPRSR